MSEWPKVYAWTPGKPAYAHYPQFANFKLFEDGRCVVTVRAPEFRTIGEEHYEMGETVCIQLPPDAAAELRGFFGADIIAKCIAITRRVRDGFLSEEYATGQPLASFNERFACDQVAQAIENEFGAAHIPDRRGSKNARAKLSDEQVSIIRKLKGKILQRHIARTYGISRQTVSAIQNGDRWQPKSHPDTP